MALTDTAFLDSKTYGFEWLRLLLDIVPLQEGVVGAGDFKVTPAAAGGQRVDVAAGYALVRGDSGTRNALYAQVNDAAIVNVTVPASNATNPRLDQVVLEVNDSSDLGSGSDTPRVYVLAGTATAGATLDNRTGAAALPNNTVRLADVLVPAASSAVTAGNVRDRRPWARGAFRRIERVANAAAGSDYAYSVAAMALIDATNMQPRLETSGVPLRMGLRGRAMTTAGSMVYFAPFVDGVAIGGQTLAFGALTGTTNLDPSYLSIDHDVIPTPGSHRLGWAWQPSAAVQATLLARATFPAQTIIQEILNADAENT